MKSPKTIWREKLSDLRPWKKGSVRAVHKPLLTLMLIGRASRNQSSEIKYSEIAGPLTKLLKEFGPSRKSHHPEYPFWHLKSNDFWVVRDADDYPLKKGGNSPTKRTLLEHGATGFVTPELWTTLVADPHLQAELASHVLEEFWPDTLHSAIREAIGLPYPTAAKGAARIRDPQFRDNVLRAYRGECAICSFDGRLAGVPLGIQAAHLKWQAYGGRDDISNGLALCSFHHLALDTGALGLTNDRRVVVSCEVTGNNKIDELLYRYEGQKIRAPQPGMPLLSEASINWHIREVFKNPGRAWPQSQR